MRDKNLIESLKMKGKYTFSYTVSLGDFFYVSKVTTLSDGASVLREAAL
jgi:hypothetical protein